jgi:hypothetical protein
MKESNSLFRVYLTGRRNCLCAHVRVKLRRRHDLLWCLYNFLVPQEDEVTYEVYFAETQMVADMVLSVARKGTDAERAAEETFKVSGGRISRA